MVQRVMGWIAEPRLSSAAIWNRSRAHQQPLYLEGFDLGRLVEAELGRQHPALLGVLRVLPGPGPSVTWTTSSQLTERFPDLNEAFGAGPMTASPAV
jgi:hypothetical protein